MSNNRIVDSVLITCAVWLVITGVGATVITNCVSSTYQREAVLRGYGVYYEAFDGSVGWKWKDSP